MGNKPTMLRLNFPLFRSCKGQSAILPVEKILSHHHFVKAAVLTKGFSGREIGKLMVAMQSKILSSKEGTLRTDEAWGVIEDKVVEHRLKAEMARKNQTGI